MTSPSLAAVPPTISARGMAHLMSDPDRCAAPPDVSGMGELR